MFEAASEVNLSKLVIASIDEMATKRTEELGVVGNVHASSIMYCMLRQYYSMTNTPVTNPNSPAEKYKLHQGNIAEAALASLMERDGYKLLSDLETVSYRGVSCTPDRILVAEIAGVEYPLAPVEFKNVDSYSFMKIAMEGLEKANLPYYVQCLLYAAALGFSGTKFFMAAKSPAAIQTEIGRKLKGLSKKPGIQSIRDKEALLKINGWSYEEWIPLNDQNKVLLERVFQRVAVLYNMLKLGTPPPREYTPGKDWQCDYCPFRIRCEIENGDRKDE